MEQKRCAPPAARARPPPPPPPPGSRGPPPPPTPPPPPPPARDAGGLCYLWQQWQCPSSCMSPWVRVTVRGTVGVL